MNLSRRTFLQSGAASLITASSLTTYTAAKKVKFKLAAPDWSLRKETKLEALALSQSIGLPGVQISIGGRSPRGQTPAKLPLSDAALQKQYLDEAKKLNVKITSLCLEILHVNGLKSDPLGQRWVADAIPIAKALGVRVILLPFFGKWQIKEKAEQERVADILREVAPAAEKLGVILGLEDTISARENVAIVDRSKSSAVMTYYDVGNSAKEGYDVVEEIRWLGNSRICEVHLKEYPWEKFMGEGQINFPGVVDALADIGFDKWAQFETSCPTGNIEADFKRNVQYIRDLSAKRNRTGSAAKA